MKKYCIVDFQGYVCWAKLDTGIYAVDPLFLEKFKALFTDSEIVEIVR